MRPGITALLVLAIFLNAATARPVRRRLNFNMFVLKPQADAPDQDRVLFSTNGVSRFGPLLEYIVQRMQGLLSVRVHPDESLPGANVPVVTDVPLADTAENEVDSAPVTKLPGVVVRPSRTKPGTYEVEMAVVVDDGQPSDDKNNKEVRTR